MASQRRAAVVKFYVAKSTETRSVGLLELTVTLDARKQLFIFVLLLAG